MYQQLLNRTAALQRKWGESVTWTVIYTVDAHPAKPDPSPYSGVPWTFQYSHLRQPRNFSQRLQNAATLPVPPNFTVLVDDLAPHNATAGNDPVWCTWGPAPNAGFLIAENKTVVLAQTWFDYDGMDRAIEELVHGTKQRKIY